MSNSIKMEKLHSNKFIPYIGTQKCIEKKKIKQNNIAIEKKQLLLVCN
jgi:hypothetical protein